MVENSQAQDSYAQLAQRQKPKPHPENRAQEATDPSSYVFPQRMDLPEEEGQWQ